MPHLLIQRQKSVSLTAQVATGPQKQGTSGPHMVLPQRDGLKSRPVAAGCSTAYHHPSDAPACPHCQATHVVKNGPKHGRQRWLCPPGKRNPVHIGRLNGELGEQLLRGTERPARPGSLIE